MKDQYTVVVTTSKEEMPLVIDNLVEAVKVLYSSVKNRKTKEMIEKMNDEDEGEKYGKFKSI